MPKPNDIPHCPEVPAQRSSGCTTREYRISLITPLFGGGVEPGKPDVTLPIRGTSIRGQLQFWWRATRGGGATDHAEVWGMTEKASPVQIEVRDVKAGPPKSCAKYAPGQDGRKRLRWEQPFDSGSLPYVLFPFQGQLSRNKREIEVPPAEFIEPASFVLRLCYPETLQQEIETAVRAWISFGGLGARTRRGCGALLCNELAPESVTEMQGWFRQTAGSRSGKVHDWPTLPSSVLIGTEPQTPIDAWKRTIDLLQRFRQGAGFARNPGRQTNRPGRSWYPEPETIRRVTEQRALQHSRLEHIPDDAFPRAELGLPIVFHFQGRSEPNDTVLYPANGPNGEQRERMASPLILKPLALADGRAVSMVVRLVTTPLKGVDLRREGVSLPLPETTVIRGARLATYRDSPLAGVASGSILDAFMGYARKDGFEEVTR
ncbi:MAG: type III-B CRISPR module RAMP protein Cmr1 [Nitrospiraceae bacterium]|nr:type III-B CRISPR module RAMP protein Cmr1 [Nitrospiraceae bacterium]